MAFLRSWVVILNKVPSKSSLVSIRVKTLSNTNLVASRHIKRDEDLLPVGVRRSKTSLLEGAVSQNSDKLGNYKMYVKLRET